MPTWNGSVIWKRVSLPPAAVLHHLRDDQDWQATFEKILSLHKPGGSVWITDLVVQNAAGVFAKQFKKQTIVNFSEMHQ